ncbi:PAAR domain-containing protein [Aurantimonas sp. VKM B-3413]|uniref:PAAR domain-containing protein n=1 Tax=Aurantimonas sp. VKM B-3413 TaxID=2779401 RepID=UPI001E61839B|nr:PAAR domain-containing protein [Aurantimonas sp. VKM B-3413]MCB8837526.1 PAAR domain-containing protein [Aurantimonas sp. VKM B-3413]
MNSIQKNHPETRMPTGPAARVTDRVEHERPGVLTPGPGGPNTLIGGLPAWRGLLDRHECHHGTDVVVDGSPTVLINGLPACREGDTILEADGKPNRITLGCQSVIIGGAAGTGS